MKRLLLFVSMWSWALAGLVNAQGHDAHWIFGMGYHMEFVDGDVVMHPILEDYIADEGASCISDKQGNLLFYSNTQRIWNRQHQPLWNGEGINTVVDTLRGSSITNGSLFLPWPGDTSDRYFAFIVRGEEDWRLFLSRIDRELDNGYGGIEPGYKNLPLSSLKVGEQLTAVRHGNGRDWWILSRSIAEHPNTNSFVSILFTTNGIDTVLASEQGLRGRVSGELTAAKRGERLAYVSPNEAQGWLGLFSFDRCTGLLTLLDSTGHKGINDTYYSVSFGLEDTTMVISSEKNGSLYKASWPDGKLNIELIYSLYGGNVTIPNAVGQTELANNGNIYIVNRYRYNVVAPNLDPLLTSHLGVFQSGWPADSALDTFAIYLSDTANATYSLPHFPNYTLGALVGSPCDSLSPPVDTSTAVAAPAPADWTVHPTVGRGAFVVRGLPLGVTVEAYDAFGRKAGTWRMDGDPLLVSGADWAAGPYWLVAVAVDGRRLGTRRVLRLGE
jgi:hypothetical protein